jgi:hypothetical protein
VFVAFASNTSVRQGNTDAQIAADAISDSRATERDTMTTTTFDPDDYADDEDEGIRSDNLDVADVAAAMGKLNQIIPQGQHE